MENPIQMIQAFNDFAKNFKGDPQAEVNKLLTDGRITQSQLNDLQARATEFQKMLSIMK